MLTQTDHERNNFSLVMDNAGGDFYSGVKMFRSPTNGNLIVEDMPVFRSGTFRNSWGEQTTYSDFHIEQMVNNFNYLKSSGIFADVPVRSSHPEPWFRNSTEEVIGYVTSLRSEVRPHPVTGKDYSYLVSSYEISDPAAAVKIEKKLFRNRSAEVGTYVDNDEAEYAPTLMGFAYVDIPAVEGLNFGKRADVRRFAMEKEGDPMGDAVENSEVVEPEVVEPEVVEPEVVEPEAVEPEVVEPEVVEPEVVEPEVISGEGDEVVSAEVGTGDHVDAGIPFGSPNIATSTFGIDINGVRVTDPMVIQEYVNNLHSVVIQSRSSFVNQLFTDERINAFQKGAMDEFAVGLTTEQWSQFRTIFDDSPVIGTLAFSRSNENHEIDIEEQKKQQLRSEVVEHLRRGIGDKVEQTEVFRQLSEKEGK